MVKSTDISMRHDNDNYNCDLTIQAVATRYCHCNLFLLNLLLADVR